MGSQPVITARQRMLALSAQEEGIAARAHFLSIRQDAGALQIFDNIKVELFMNDYEVEIENELVTDLESQTLEVSLDTQDYVVEVD